MRTKIGKWGNSLAVRLPKKTASKFGLKEGTEVKVAESEAQIVIKIPSPTGKLKKADWENFVVPTLKKKQNVSGKIDKILYGKSY